MHLDTAFRRATGWGILCCVRSPFLTNGKPTKCRASRPSRTRKTCTLLQMIVGAGHCLNGAYNTAHVYVVASANKLFHCKVARCPAANDTSGSLRRAVQTDGFCPSEMPSHHTHMVSSTAFGRPHARFFYAFELYIHTHCHSADESHPLKSAFLHKDFFTHMCTHIYPDFSPSHGGPRSGRTTHNPHGWADLLNISLIRTFLIVSCSF